MDNVSIQINVPRGMESYIETLTPEMEFARNAMMLYPFIQNVTISHGKAAEILGVKKLDLIEFYNKMGMPYLQTPEDEIDAEISMYKKFRQMVTR